MLLNIWEGEAALFLWPSNLTVNFMVLHLPIYLWALDMVWIVILYVFKGKLTLMNSSIVH